MPPFMEKSSLPTISHTHTHTHTHTLSLSLSLSCRDLPLHTHFTCPPRGGDTLSEHPVCWPLSLPHSLRGSGEQRPCHISVFLWAQGMAYTRCSVRTKACGTNACIGVLPEGCAVGSLPSPGKSGPLCVVMWLGEVGGSGGLPHAQPLPGSLH